MHVAPLLRALNNQSIVEIAQRGGYGNAWGLLHFLK
jgi:hypothetical protein